MDYLEQVLLNTHRIDPNLYEEYDVKRGLRDSNGKGVLTGKGVYGNYLCRSDRNSRI